MCCTQNNTKKGNNTMIKLEIINFVTSNLEKSYLMDEKVLNTEKKNYN